MPIPFILAGLAVAAGAYGAKKGYDAHEKNSKAKRIINRAEDLYNKTKDEIEEKQLQTNNRLIELGELKVNIFTNEIKTFIELISKCKQASSSFEDKSYISEEELKNLNIAVNTSLKISAGVASGTVAGVLSGMGAYGTVGMLASASTGTAISTLSGAAATNATLAWLGGGSLATGGLGIAGGTMILGGLVAGPLLAVGGMFLDSRAEENLTQAYEVRREADKAVESMHLISTGLDGIVARVSEIEGVLYKTMERFNNVKDTLPASYCKEKDFKVLLMLGKTLKNLLDIPVLNEEGQANTNMTTRINQVLHLG
jgi:hypothetical protein